MRAASTACTVAGRAVAASGRARRRAPRAPDQHARLDRGEHELLDEERVARGALADVGLERRERRVRADQIVEQRVDGLGPERSERQAPRADAAAPR